MSNKVLLNTIGSCLLTLSMFSMANAALWDRGGGMIYDDDLDITWLADANYSVAWATGLSVGGYTDWRLPTTTQPDSGCSIQYSGQGFGFNCTNSEMGHLFYNELSGTGGSSILTSTDPDLALFSNIQGSNYGNYWSGTEYSLTPSTSAWHFFFSDGFQGQLDNGADGFVWAVRPGDVSLVPIPATIWLLGSGLIGLIGIARKKKTHKQHYYSGARRNPVTI